MQNNSINSCNKFSYKNLIPIIAKYNFLIRVPILINNITYNL